MATVMRTSQERPEINTQLGLGTLNFKISLDVNDGIETLHVELRSAEDLQKMDTESSDPFAKVYLLAGPGWADPVHIFQKDKFRTRTFSQVTEVLFREEGRFHFPLNNQHTDNIKLVLEMWDEDMTKENDYMGGVTILVSDLRTLGLSVSRSLQLRNVPLKLRDDSNQPIMMTYEALSVLLTENWSSHDNRTPTVTIKISYDTTSNHLQILMMKAKNLPAPSNYGRVYLVAGGAGSNAQQAVKFGRPERTAHHYHSHSPVIEELFQFKVTVQQAKAHRVAVEFIKPTSHLFQCGVMFSISYLDFISEMQYEVPLYRDKDAMPHEISGLETFQSLQSVDISRYRVSAYSGRVWVSKDVNFGTAHVGDFVTTHVRDFQTSNVGDFETADVTDFGAARVVTASRQEAWDSSSSGSLSDVIGSDDARSQLQRSNDRLVEYIHKARIIAQTKSIISAIPRTINPHEKVTEKNEKEQDVIRVENRFISVREADRLDSARRLEELKRENERLHSRYREKEAEWDAIQKQVDVTMREIIEWRGKVEMLEYSITVINKKIETKELEIELIQPEPKADEISMKAKVKEAWDKIDIERKKLIRESVATDEDKLHLNIKVISDYKERMMAELISKRESYIDQIADLKATLIVSLFKDFATLKQDGLEADEKRKIILRQIDSFRETESELSDDLESLYRQVADREADFNRQKEQHRAELERASQKIEVKIRELTHDLQAWFKEQGEELHQHQREQLELQIYDTLLGFEEDRLASPHADFRELVAISMNRKHSIFTASSHRYLSNDLPSEDDVFN